MLLIAKDCLHVISVEFRHAELATLKRFVFGIFEESLHSINGKQFFTSVFRDLGDLALVRGFGHIVH
jgi:hypothetical protein